MILHFDTLPPEKGHISFVDDVQPAIDALAQQHRRDDSDRCFATLGFMGVRAGEDLVSNAGAEQTGEDLLVLADSLTEAWHHDAGEAFLAGVRRSIIATVQDRKAELPL